MTSPDFGLSIIASWIASRIDSYFNNKNNQIEINNELEKDIVKSEITEQKEQEETEVLKLLKRFKELLLLMNENQGEHNKFTVAKLSEILNLEKRSILDNIIAGREEPTFEFIKSFCKTFRINYDWLIESKGYPFNIEYNYFSPMDYLKDIIELNPERIYFIQNKSETAETFIMLGFSEWYYMAGTKTWHISNNVGGSGQGQIYDLYKLIKELKENMFSSKCKGLKLESKEFYNILCGRSFPGSCLIGEMGWRGDNPWWDDFTDITHYYPITDRYEEMHGKSFIDAQNIVKYQIEKYNKTE